jgi:sec-independent protein translocase protein TatC
VVNQLLMAGPLIVLYEVSIIGAKLFGKKRVKQEEEGAKESDAGEGQGK